MRSKPTSAPDPTARSSKSALLEAAQEAIADQNSRPVRLSPVPAARRLFFRGFLAVMVASSGATLLLQPEWLAGPKPKVEAPEITAATATITLVQLVSRVQAYQEENGHLPTDLRDITGANPAVTFHAETGGAFELSLKAGDSVVAVRTTDSLQARLIEAIRTLQRRT